MRRGLPRAGGYTATRLVPAEDAQAALDACSDAVLGIDADGVCAVANSAAQRIFGRARTELVGIGAHQLLPGLASVIDEATDRRQRGDRRSGPAGPGTAATAVRMDGVRFPVAVWLAPSYGTGGRLTVFLTVRDLTSARATEAAHRELREEVATLRDEVGAICRAVRDRAIWVLDQEGHVLQANRAAEKLLGYRAAEIAGRPCAVLSEPADLAEAAAELGSPPGVDPLLEITRSGLPNLQDWTLRAKDGEPREVSLHIVAIGPRQNPTGFVWVAAERDDPGTPDAPRSVAGRLLLDLDDAETRTLRWQVGGSGSGRRR